MYIYIYIYIHTMIYAEELEAIAKAIEIISSGAVSGNADKHLPSLLQKGSSLAMLRADLNNADQSKVRVQVVTYLKDQSKKLNSRLLSTLAMKVGSDPFKKVKKMIKDLIVKLMEEAAEETEHKDISLSV